MKDPHEFIEDINDASMCVCGIPSMTHDCVMDRAAAAEVIAAAKRKLDADDAADGGARIRRAEAGAARIAARRLRSS